MNLKSKMLKAMLLAVIMVLLVSLQVSAGPVCETHDFKITNIEYTYSYHSHYVLPQAETCYYYIKHPHITRTCQNCGEVDHGPGFSTEGGHDFSSCK
ncbi:hypothetical protein [Wukongibacter sp. M2B1]|uniref:hypothetical protein n=1 Tax=Wukongibacter sp. M2B1 TaxID=3088895 RepID=UPI003D7BF2CE